MTCLLRLWNKLAGVVGLATIMLHSSSCWKEKLSLVMSPGRSASSLHSWRNRSGLWGREREREKERGGGRKRERLLSVLWREAKKVIHTDNSFHFPYLPRWRMFWSHSLVAVGEEEDEPALTNPLVLTRADELVNDTLQYCNLYHMCNVMAASARIFFIIDLTIHTDWYW